jgi:C-terminal processing protease CtpA/Prc
MSLRFSCFRFVSILASTLISLATYANVTEVLTPEQAQQDVRILKRALTELHPALTKYQTQTEMDAAFARFEARGGAARTATAMYLAATELAAAIRCGHTWTNTLNQASAVQTALMESRNKLPFLITPVESRWLITASAANGVVAGDELISINGIGAAEIVARMMPYLRADGSSDGKRIIQLSHDRDATNMMDLVWPLLSPPVNGNYEIEVQRSNGKSEKLNVSAVTFQERNTKLAANGADKSDKKGKGEAWSLRIENKVGILTLPTFSFWQSKFDWAKFLDESFAELNAKKIPNLIIDIRANEGGDGAINRAIMSHLLQQPFTWPATQPIVAYERAPYALAKHLDTWDYRFFDRTGQVEKLGERRYLYKTKAAVDRTIKPVDSPYAGKTFMLVSAENSSATFQLAYLAKRASAATLVGQTTGGNLRGLNGGELAWVTLPNSGVAVDIPLVASVALEPQPDAGITPDIVVKRTFAARAAGEDTEMLAAQNAIRAR